MSSLKYLVYHYEVIYTLNYERSHPPALLGKIKARARQAGNILFLILLAVVLFAALSYTVTRAIQGGGKNASSEKDSSQISSMMSYATAVSNAYVRLTLTGGCEPSQISFNNDSDGDGNFIDAGDYWNNTTSPTSLRCHLFHQNGGGLTYNTFLETIQRPTTTDSNIINLWNNLGQFGKPSFVYGYNMSGTPASDPTIFFHHVRSSICAKIANEYAGLSTTPFHNYYHPHFYGGINVVDQSSQTANKSISCGGNDVLGYYAYVVLKEN